MPTNSSQHAVCLEKERIERMDKSITTHDVYIKILIGVMALVGANSILLLAFLANEYIKK